ncbi:MAG: aminoacyl-tRNA deacylase [Anaerolineales bacterium]|jgi:Cys-tRNA(Pro)/Cys-tRNA(Cys) deacylase|nr:aminoacyl-tRNA deacylase [Anaerolineales bacterium]
MKTNNITRLLEARKIPFSAYELPEEKLGALETARLLNVPPEQVFKTIVIKREGKGKAILAIVPGASEVDLKALAKAVGEKKLFLASEREAEALTGLLSGGISPLALINKGFQVLVDQSASTFDSVHISGGQRGLNIRLPVNDLLKLVNARLAEISTRLSP